jgi:hypothetical protein
MTTRLVRTTAIHFTRRFSTAARHLLAPRLSTKTYAQRDGRPEATATLHAILFTGAVAASSAAARRRVQLASTYPMMATYLALPLGPKPPLAPGDIPSESTVCPHWPSCLRAEDVARVAIRDPGLASLHWAHCSSRTRGAGGALFFQKY